MPGTGAGRFLLAMRFPGQKAHIGILGGGAWGTAIAVVLAEKGNKVDIWCYEEEVAAEINSKHTNSRYLMGVDLPDRIKAVTDPLEAVNKKDFLLVAIPSLYLMATIKKIITIPNIMECRTLIGILSKGFIETAKGIQLITEAMEDYLPGIYKGNLVYISGPSHAEEVARGKITGLISASVSGRNSIRFRELLTGGRLMVFSSLDIKGVQISAALKNVIAIAFGMLDALKEFSDQFGDNTESLLLAAGLNEILLMGQALGATHAETFSSIAGVGDLDVTCRSKYGRNRRLGREIILARLLEKYNNIEEIISDLPNIGYYAEGVSAARYTWRLTKKYNLNLPICSGVYRILNREVEPLQEVELILKRITGESKIPPVIEK